jgi:hypothetical protein
MYKSKGINIDYPCIDYQNIDYFSSVENNINIQMVSQQEITPNYKAINLNPKVIFERYCK